MLRKTIMGFCGALALLAMGQSRAAVVDTVTSVSSCGQGGTIIHMANNGWFYATISSVGAAQTEALTTVALVLLQTGHQTRFFYAGPTASTVCGVSARPIYQIGFKNTDHT